MLGEVTVTLLQEKFRTLETARGNLIHYLIVH